MPTCSRLLVALSLILFASGCAVRGGGGGGGGGDLTVATDQLVLELSFVALLDAYSCSPDAGQTTIQCADYEIPFTLTHTGDDVLGTLDRIEVTGGDMTFEATTDCTDRPWQPEPGESESETLSIRYDGEGGIPAFFHRCGGAMMQRTNAAVGDAPLDGELQVTVEIVGEEYRHIAVATAPIVAP